MQIDLNRLSPAAQRQIIEKMGQKRPKYGNQKATRLANGKAITFDSQKEARRYDELMILLRAGRITGLKLQPEFTLQEAYKSTNGNHVRAERYRADFSYWMDGEFVVEDVKSKATKTALYKSKKKRVEEKYGIEIKEVE